MAVGASNTLKREWAKELYCKNEYTQKEIANKVGISENSLSKWVNEGHWDTMRKTLLTTNSEILRDLYDTLDAMRKEAKKAATDDDPATKPDSDGIYKMALAIKKLQVQTGIGEVIETAQGFVKFVQSENLELAKEITKWFDLYIESKLKSV